MKRPYIPLMLLAVLLAALLGGCRTRILSAPEGADRVVYQPLPQEQPETPPPPEPEKPPEELPEELPAPEEPERETPQAAEAPLEPETLDDPGPEEELSDGSESTRPDLAATVSAAGAETFRPQPQAGITVIYDPNGGDGPTVKAVVTPGQPYGPQPEPLWRGHVFLGWFTEKAGGTQVLYTTTVTQEGDHSLFAQWQTRSASTVTLDGNGGRVKARESKLQLSDGDPYGTLPTPLREGYTFLGWFTLPEDGEAVLSDTVFTGAEDRTLYAQWAYDPFAFWSFTLKNRTQQVYLCQQASIYFEESPGVTRQSVGLISATGSLNVAESRADPQVTDDWILAKKPDVVMALTTSLTAAKKAELAERFPDQKIILVNQAALSGDAGGLYARLALAKELYPDWYQDVDLSVVSAELGVTDMPIYF